MELTTDKRKNESESVRKSKEEAYRYFKEYCEYSGIHGLRYITEQRTLCERIWWITALLLSIALSGYMIYEIADKYLHNPVMITFSSQEEYISNIPFPAVTICPIATISKDYFDLADTFGVDDDKLNGEIGKAYNLASMICDFYYVNTTDTYNSTTADDLYNFLNESMPDIFETCLYKRREPDCSESFKPILTEKGVCFSFNILNKNDMFRDDVFSLPGYHSTQARVGWNIQMGYDDSESVPYPSRALSNHGAENRLSVLLKTKISDIHYMCSFQETGYKVAVHLPSKIPDMSEFYLSVPLNQSVTWHIIPNLIKTSSGVKAFSTDKRDCYFEEERPLKYFKIYNLENCLMECKTNLSLELCGCVSFFMPRHNDTPVCMMNSSDCSSNVKGKVLVRYLEETNLIIEELFLSKKVIPSILRQNKIMKKTGYCLGEYDRIRIPI